LTDSSSIADHKTAAQVTAEEMQAVVERAEHAHQHPRFPLGNSGNLLAPLTRPLGLPNYVASSRLGSIHSFFPAFLIRMWGIL
jgi:hypothetical protein